MRRGRLAVAVFIAAVTAACGGSPPEAASGECRDWVAAKAYAREIAQARALVARMDSAFAAPGLSVAVGAGGKLVWSESCGFADLGRRIPVSRTTRFRIGSVSKPITAAAAARLSQEGKLDLDADVRRYVPTFHHAVTPRQLGGHLGGIRHYRGAEALNTVHYDSVADGLRAFASDPLVAPPGERYSYSSYGFSLLGAAVAAAAGTPFSAAVEALVLRPLSMASTGLGPARGTRFYEVTGARRAVAAPKIDLSDRAPSGGFLSTAEDLVRLGLGVTDPAFLDARSRRLLFTTQRTRAGEPTGYGFGFELHDSPFGVVAGHTGNVVGGTAFLLVHPRTRVVVALSTNIGFVTVARPPDLSAAPDPPAIALPFMRRVLQSS